MRWIDAFRSRQFSKNPSLGLTISFSFPRSHGIGLMYIDYKLNMWISLRKFNVQGKARTLLLNPLGLLLR